MDVKPETYQWFLEQNSGLRGIPVPHRISAVRHRSGPHGFIRALRIAHTFACRLRRRKCSAEQLQALFRRYRLELQGDGRATFRSRIAASWALLCRPEHRLALIKKKAIHYKRSVERIRCWSKTINDVIIGFKVGTGSAITHEKFFPSESRVVFIASRRMTIASNNPAADDSSSAFYIIELDQQFFRFLAVLANRSPLNGFPNSFYSFCISMIELTQEYPDETSLPTDCRSRA